MSARAASLALIAGLGAGAADRALAADVAVLLSADVDHYREAVTGFEKASGHRIVAIENMEGKEIERGRQILQTFERDVRPDMILAVGVWALQAVADAELRTPVVYTMVLNPPAVLAGRAGDVTGSSMNVPVASVLDVVAELGGDIRRIGAMYNPRTTGFLITQAQALASGRRLELVARPIKNAAEALAAVDSLEQADVDVIWILPDADTLGEKVVSQLLLLSYRKSIPVVGLSEDHARKGAVVALSFASSEDIGRQAGELSKKVLAPGKGGGTEFTMVRSTSLVVNLKAARKMRLEIPASLVARATEVIR